MKFFCKSETLSPVIAIAAFDAGYLVAKADPEFAKRAIPVADAILALIAKNSEAGSINGVFQSAIKELVEQIKDPMVKMNVMAVLSMVEIQIDAPEVKVLDVPVIEGLVSNFKAGAAAFK